jgi:hypothetical protein
LLAGLHVADFLAGSLADTIVGLQAINLSCELAIDTNKCIELRSALLEIVVLFAPCIDWQDEDSCRHRPDDGERSNAGEQRDLGPARQTFVNRNRPSDVTQA